MFLGKLLDVFKKTSKCFRKNISKFFVPTAVTPAKGLPTLSGSPCLTWTLTIRQSRSSARTARFHALASVSVYCTFAFIVCVRYFFKAFHPTSIFSFSSHNRRNKDFRLCPNVSGGTWSSGFSLWHFSSL